MATAVINSLGAIAKAFAELSQLTTANANTDGATGAYVTTHAGATGGSVLTRVDVKASGTTTAGAVRLFLSDGSNARLVGEISVTAITPSPGVTKSFEGSWTPPQGSLPIPNGWTLKSCTVNSETFNLTATGTDYTN